MTLLCRLVVMMAEVGKIAMYFVSVNFFL
jgi:hypothetical protein